MHNLTTCLCRKRKERCGRLSGHSSKTHRPAREPLPQIAEHVCTHFTTRFKAGVRIGYEGAFARLERMHWRMLAKHVQYGRAVCPIRITCKAKPAAHGTTMEGVCCPIRITCNAKPAVHGTNMEGVCCPTRITCKAEPAVHESNAEGPPAQFCKCSQLPPVRSVRIFRIPIVENSISSTEILHLSQKSCHLDLFDACILSDAAHFSKAPGSLGNLQYD